MLQDVRNKSSDKSVIPLDDIQEEGDACHNFSRQRCLPLKRDDAMQPTSELEAESHHNFYGLLEHVDFDSIAPIKEEWIFNVCGMVNIEAFTAIPQVLFRMSCFCLEWCWLAC